MHYGQVTFTSALSYSQRFIYSNPHKRTRFVRVSQHQSKLMVRPLHYSGMWREPNQARAAHREIDPQMFGINPGVRTHAVADLHLAAAHEGHLFTATDFVPPSN